MKKRYSMRNKILFLCLTSIIVVLLVQIILFNQISMNTTYEQSKERNLRLLSNMQEDIGDVIKRLESGLLEIYNEKDLIDDLRSHRPASMLSERNYRIAYNMAQNFDVEDRVVATYIYDDFNRIISAYRHSSTPIYNYPEDLFENIPANNVKPLRQFMDRESKGVLISGYYNTSRKKDIIRFALNIFDQNYPRTQVGCVVADVDSEIFTDIIEKYTYENRNITWLQPLGDRVIVSMHDALPEYEATFQQIADDIKAERIDREQDPEINDAVLFRLSNTKYNLEIVSLIPPSILIETQRVLIRSMIITTFILLLIFGFAAVMVARGITKPLEHLSNTMRSVRKGDRTLRVDSLGNDEIGELGENFNKMLDEMEVIFAHEYNSKLMLQRAEYKALQAQINPHFLYNTLDTMSSIAQIENCMLVSDLCGSLSAIFRYSLNIKNPMSTIEEEILHLKHYIYLMDVRMRGNVHYSFDIEEKLLRLEIPRLTMQPIIENALNHGLREITGEKKVLVAIKEVDDEILVIVEDNGIGMDPKLLNEKLASDDFDYAEQGNSIGLHNINIRIKLLFGKEYGIRVESIPGEGTKVIVRFPAKTEEKRNEQKI